MCFLLSFKLKLTSEEVKSRLGNSKNLAELRAKLSKVNDWSAKVKEFYESKVHLKKFSNLEFNLSVPVRYSYKYDPFIYI